jgi:hypothetical protein
LSISNKDEELAGSLKMFELIGKVDERTIVKLLINLHVTFIVRGHDPNFKYTFRAQNKAVIDEQG